MLACLPQLRASSVALCADAERHYLQAATAVTTAAAAILPLPVGTAAMLPRRLGPRGAFYAVHAAALLGGYVFTLAVIFRFELSHRRAFARRRRLAAEMAALLRWRAQWALGVPLTMALSAMGWLACYNLVQGLEPR